MVITAAIMERAMVVSYRVVIRVWVIRVMMMVSISVTIWGITVMPASIRLISGIHIRGHFLTSFIYGLVIPYE
jgi:hypothetical protein